MSFHSLKFYARAPLFVACVHLFLLQVLFRFLQHLIFFFYLLKQTKEAGATTYFRGIKSPDLLKQKKKKKDTYR
jgi:hypothetical protein